MKLEAVCVCFDMVGSSGTFRTAQALVERDTEDFGEALETVSVDLRFRSAKPFAEQDADKSLKSSYRTHHVLCDEPHERRFERKKKRLRLIVTADFATAEEVRDDRTGREAWQGPLLRLLATELEACRKKFKRSDDLDLDGLTAHFRSLAERLPLSAEEAASLDEQLDAVEEARLEAMDPWERLGINWKTFHPDARTLVDDTRLWGRGHPFSPHGSDNSADMMWRFEKAKSRSARDEGRPFFRKMKRDWGFSDDALPTDEINFRMSHEVAIALAFAFLKHRGECPPWLRDHAIERIDTYVAHIESTLPDWSYRDLCLEYQALMRGVLSAA